MRYYKQIVDSMRLMKLKFLLHNIFNARHYFTECKVHVVIRIEAIANLGFNDVSAGMHYSHRYVVANGSRKVIRYQLLVFPF